MAQGSRTVGRIVLPLAVLLLHGTDFGASNADPLEGRGERRATQHSPYAVVTAGDDATPYAQQEVPAVPWSHGQSYAGLDAADLRAALGARRPAYPTPAAG